MQLSPGVDLIHQGRAKLMQFSMWDIDCIKYLLVGECAACAEVPASEKAFFDVKFGISQLETTWVSRLHLGTSNNVAHHLQPPLDMVETGHVDQPDRRAGQQRIMGVKTRELFKRKRLAYEVALGDRASRLKQELTLLPRLDALGDDFDVEFMSKSDRRPDDRGVLA